MIRDANEYMCPFVTQNRSDLPKWDKREISDGMVPLAIILPMQIIHSSFCRYR